MSDGATFAKGLRGVLRAAVEGRLRSAVVVAVDHQGRLVVASLSPAVALLRALPVLRDQVATLTPNAHVLDLLEAALEAAEEVTPSAPPPSARPRQPARPIWSSFVTTFVDELLGDRG